MRLLGCLAALLMMPVQTAAAWEKGAGYLELADRLDRPQDGWCLDAPGSGDWVDFSVPLNAHNCKGPEFYPDEAVIFDAERGQIRFPAYGACVTALGRDGRSLPFSPLTARACVGDRGVREDPFTMENLQRFEHLADGRIRLQGSQLCLAVGAVSDVTFAADHRWRVLYLADCSTAPAALSVWKPFAPRD